MYSNAGSYNKPSLSSERPLPASYLFTIDPVLMGKVDALDDLILQPLLRMCPGCLQPIAPGTAHLVAWRADGVLGDAADLASRRHWHTHCWKIGT